MCRSLVDSSTFEKNMQEVYIMATKTKRDYINEYIDLSGCRLTEDEADRLIDVINNIDVLTGQSHDYKEIEHGWYSGGRFVRTTITRYTLCYDRGRIYINEHQESEDDDGGSFKLDRDHTSAREILKLLNRTIR